MRCYFNLVGAQQTLVDNDGVEVDNLDEGHALVREAIAEIIQDGEAEIADWRGWRLEAVDASGAVLFAINLDAVPVS